MRITLDFETRSRSDLRKVGAWKYAEHESTEVMCLALKVDEDPVQIWIMPELIEGWDNLWIELDIDHVFSADEVLDLIESADIIEAHNMEFERAIWHHVLHKKHNWPDLPFEKLRCSAAKAAMHALPRNLEQACKALNLPVQKDEEGHRLMLQMCKPRKPSKANPNEWWETPDKLVRLFKYCMQDVEAEHCLSRALSDLPPSELEIWRLDQQINARGIYTDTESAAVIIDKLAHHEKGLLGQMSALTDGKVKSPRQHAVTLKWVNEQGIDADNIQAATVDALLEKGGLPEKARDVLRIRRSLSKSSCAKFQAMIARAGSDSRIRGTLMYHGAGTGRWSGVGIQPQNLPRGTFSDVQECIDAFKAGDMEVFEMLYGDPMVAASSCIRGMLCASPGHELVCADFSAIEGRVLAWVVQETEALDVYIKGIDPYKIAAAPIYSTTYENVSKSQRQVGKVAELALGYQGGISAFESMARGYDLDFSEIVHPVLSSARPDMVKKAEHAAKTYKTSCIRAGKEPIPKEQAMACDIIKQTWRENRPMTTRFWQHIESTAVKAVVNPGDIASYAGIKFGTSKNFLLCRLPSGRVLYYYSPKVQEVKTPWGAKKFGITYRSVDSVTRQWVRQKTYGGKLTENIVQAIARDLMAEGMLRVEAAGYPVVMSVHDELVSEVPIGFGSVEEYENIMSEIPDWAQGCPVAAEGWKDLRYKK